MTSRRRLSDGALRRSRERCAVRPRLFLFLFALCAFAPGRASLAAQPEWMDDCDRGEIERYLSLAEASLRAYDDSMDGLVETRSGCVALIEPFGHGDVSVAFRGSVIGDREKRHLFSSLGGRAMRQTYRDWAATNLKQVTGFLPRQYVDAAELVAREAATLPVDMRLYVTGHSKGGGAAEYAVVAAYLNPDLTAAQKGRIRGVTFNAAVVAAMNWKRLLRRFPGADLKEARRRLGEPGRLVAVAMSGDPVSRIGAGGTPAFGSCTSHYLI